MSLTEFLLARIAEDEVTATFHRNDAWFIEDHGPDWWRDPSDENLIGGGKPVARFDAEHGLLAIHHVVRWNPERVLAECEAKRRIVSEFLENERIAAVAPEVLASEVRRTNLCLEGVLLHLARVYADHPDYDQTWRP